MMKQVKLPDGTTVPAVGQGTWQLGEDPARLESEIESLRLGISLGMTLIDTAEMYGHGKSELLVGYAIQELDREKLFLVSKVLPSNADYKNIFKSCEESLERMKTNYLDLYLLHWRGDVPLEETVECMEDMVNSGKIRRWGVSNFNYADMQELWNLKNGHDCTTDQVLYHIASRGIEFDLMPWMSERAMPVMAYCPLAVGGGLKKGLYQNPVLTEIARARNITAAQLILAFILRNGNVIAIPRTGNPEHVRQNAKAADIELTPEEIKAINAEYPAPGHAVALDVQ